MVNLLGSLGASMVTSSIVAGRTRRVEALFAGKSLL